MFAANIDGFEELLHIPEPWYIDHVNFDLEIKQLDVFVKFRKRALFACSDCGEPNQPVKDIAAKDRTWRHLNFFEYPCYIHAELPRTHCGKCNRTMRVNVPWALDKPKHYFTLYFDALIIALAKDMPMNAVSRFFPFTLST